jgi:GTP-binding protein
MLTGTKNLALTSSTPGKTQLINYFEVNDRFFLVDLPGYGYAKRSKVIRDSWDDLISTYILGRSYLLNTYVLVDSRIKPQMLDLLFMKNMAFNERPFTIVFTKADKLKPDVLKNHIENYKETLLEEWVELPEMIVTSAVTNAGREALLDHILAIRKLFPSGDKS